jgi:hypothetical protein
LQGKKSAKFQAPTSKESPNFNIEWAPLRWFWSFGSLKLLRSFDVGICFFAKAIRAVAFEKLDTAHAL